MRKEGYTIFFKIFLVTEKIQKVFLRLIVKKSTMRLSYFKKRRALEIR